MKPDFIRKILGANLGLALVEGLFVFGNYIQTPSESAAAIFLGFSPLRLAILAAVLLALMAIGYLFVATLNPQWWERTPGQRLEQLLCATALFWSLLVALLISYYLVFSSDPYLGFVARYRERLFPILIWFSVVVMQLLFSWLAVRASQVTFLASFRDVLAPAGIALLSIFGLVLLVGVTRIGITPDQVYWQEAGVPLLFVQILGLSVIGVLLYVFISSSDIANTRKADVFIFIALWMFTFAIWAGTPARPSYNLLDPAEPNFQGYPFGDAMLYDVTAQNFLIGKPIPADFWAKPLYSLFLAILHLIAGQDFALVTLLQVGFLAVIPSFLFLLTGILGGRLAGILAALLLILREWNAIRLANVIQVSHVKLLLSDVFAMGGMILLTWLMLQWLQTVSVRRATPIAVGGAMGLLILMRGHPVLIVPVLFMIAFFFLQKDRSLLWDGLLKLILGLLIVMLPWFWHVYDLTGRLAFQDTSSSFATKDAFVQAYSETGSADAASYGQFESQILKQVLTQPLEVARFVASHYSHNAIFSYLFLPQSFAVESLRSYAKRQPFWGTWQGELSLEGWILIVIHACILALGLGAAWKKTKGLILVPVLIGAAYNLSVAVSRRSGWRFIQPADWVTLVFYAIGIVHLILIAAALVRRSIPEQTSQPVETKQIIASVPSIQSYVFVSLPFLLIMMVLLWGHHVFPSDSKQERDEIVQMYQTAAGGESMWRAEQLEQFLQRENAALIQGRVLYPIFFKANTGALNYSWLSFAPKPYKRLAFYVIGVEPAGVILPADSSPAPFPDGANVIVLGCKTESGDIDAISVVVASTEPWVTYHRDPMPALGCPLAEPE